MRFLLGIAIATVIAATVWSSFPTVAKQHNTVSIDPAGMTTSTTNLPTEQFDLF
jgi:hypothetical protein